MDTLDGSEDVNDFLQRIRELGEKRDKEDEERTRKLEEEILQGRKERQARRAERARSLSPTKDSPSNAGTPGSIRSQVDTPTHEKTNKPPMDLTLPSTLHDAEVGGALDRLSGSPSKDDGDKANMNFARDLPQALANTSTSLRTSPSAAMAPCRAGTLSWQQRPSSRGSAGARSRPLSMVAAGNSTARSPRATPEPTTKDDTELPRSQIAQTLGSKDPSWFKQTADRGLGSSAYRRVREAEMSHTASVNGSIRLPGLSRDSIAEPEKAKTLPPQSLRSRSPSGESSDRDGSGWSKEYSSNASMSSTGGVWSPLPTSTAHRFEPPVSDTASSAGSEQPGLSRTLAMSPSQGRILPERIERPPSPTKGLGGFVQSAMLKRSDSVNKRWSAQAGPGLSRGNSIASNSGGYGGSNNGLAGLSGSMNPPKEAWPSQGSREPSPLTGSRPGSSYSSATLTQGVQENEKPDSPDLFGSKLDPPSEDSFVKPAIPHHARSRFVANARDNEGENVQLVTTPPMSPSKTMDPKRWSPTKASWLESAINKPDSPKPKAAPPQQPSWMVEVNKAKQQRGSIDLGNGGGFKEVSTGGLLRSPPLGGPLKPLSIGGLPNGFSSGMVKKNGRGDRSDSEPLVNTESLPAKLASAQLSPSASLSVAGVLAAPTEVLKPTEEKKEASKERSVTPVPCPDEYKQSPVVKPSATVAKQKPETPPKKDFRSALKPRQVSGGGKTKDEPEFKNVFGKLKRTQTSNYVAPDELKSNILRGKAGLTVTGGPKKTERVDELKESILKKKEEMKAGGPSTLARKTSSNSVTKDRDPPTPEAIAKRNALTRSDSLHSNGSNGSEHGSTTPEAIARQKNLHDKPKPLLPAKQAVMTSRTHSNEAAAGGKLADRFNPALAGLLSRGPSPMAGNPVAANKAALPRSNDSITDDKGQDSGSNQGHLTHMTKARARGPRRRLPTSGKEVSRDAELDRSPLSTSQAQPASPRGEGEQSSARSLSTAKSQYRPLSESINNNNSTPHVSLPKPSTPPKKPNVAELTPRLSHSSNATKPRPEQPRYLTPNISTPLAQKPLLVPKDIKTDEADKISSSGPRPLSSPSRPHDALQGRQQQTLSPMQHNQPRQAATDHDEAAVSVKSAAALWAQSPDTVPITPQGPRSPIKLPTKEDEEIAMDHAGLRPLSIKGEELVGLGLQSVHVKPLSQEPLDRSLPSPPMQSPKSPPMPAKKPTSLGNRAVSNGTDKARPSMKSPIPQTSEASRLFAEFFGEALTSDVKVDIDAHTILSSKPRESDKIKTLRKQIWEVTGDGKKVPVPSHQEHILFEDSMYLCTHVFGAANGARMTETYLWAGDGVSDSAVQDALLFSRRAAKEHNGKLIILKQGKETANFFQALGGIVITRRGSSSRADSSALYMLCGRRHVGQIAFDEVDLSPQSLCSGFPYIISAKFGKLYLWKGKGSSADELGCARLIGMDVGLTGEIEEVDEGHEPPSFFDAFPTGFETSLRKSADHWRLKPNLDKYCCRLFSIEHETRPKSSSPFWGRRGSAPLEDSKITALIREISPFCQTDLEVDNIFVLDAFFEIYM
ncbi:MAG: hypothetical protein M1830_000366 [Pleopsidium flavum]|nr:MAG: hypothetical protein M1830_000366 [Pleopsidium flavum]